MIELKARSYSPAKSDYDLFDERFREAVNLYLPILAYEFLPPFLKVQDVTGLVSQVTDILCERAIGNLPMQDCILNDVKLYVDARYHWYSDKQKQAFKVGLLY